MTLEADVRNMLQEYGVGFEQNSKSFILACPRCNKSDKLYIRRHDGRFVCWKCRETDGFQGRVEYVLSELCQVAVSDVRKRLFGGADIPAEVYLDIDVKDYTDEDDYIEIEEPLRPMACPLDFATLDKPLAAPGRAYLESRGIPVDVAMSYDIRYWPSRQRVIFPVISGGEWYGYQGRLIANDKPYWNEKARKLIKPLKILTNEELRRDRVLMFSDRLRGCKHAILTEGPVDALKAHLCGGNVAAMGKAVSRQQLQLLRNGGVQKLYLGLDPDAYLELDRIRKAFHDIKVYDFRPPAPYKDLGDMSMEAVHDLFAAAPELNPAHIVLHLKNHFGA